MMKIAKIVMIIVVVISIIVGLMGPYSIKEKVIYTCSMVFWGAMDRSYYFNGLY